MLFFYRFFLFSCSLIIFNACDSSLPSSTSAIVNDNATASVEELLLELEIQQEDRFVVLDSVKNIEVFINGEYWAIFDYKSPSQSRFDDLVEINDFLTTDLTFSHKLVLDYLTTAEEFTTAGEYADFIRNFLQPGDYFCSIVSLFIYDQKGQAKELELFEDFLIKVESQEKSIYVGEIKVEI